MSDLGMIGFELDIRSYFGGFKYEVMFFLKETDAWYRGYGTAPSPSQCFDAAMAYLAECMREAQPE